MKRTVVLLSIIVSTSATGFTCVTDDDPCIEVSADCQPLYEPTYEQIYSRLLEPTCGDEGTQCHAPEGAKNGLIFADPDEAYDLLLGVADGRQRVVPGDPGCSMLVQRIEATGNAQMPPLSRLSEPERCAVIQWVANGAER